MMSRFKRLLLPVLLILFLAQVQEAYGQYPPRPVVVTPTGQGLAFGAFYQGAGGGTVSVSPAGSRTATGDVVLFFGGFTFSAARFNIRGNPGTLVTMMAGPAVILNGSNGGSMTLTIGPANPPPPFVLTNPWPVPMEFFMGGTLTVGSPAANPPGTYSGTFTIIFNQQ